MTLFFGNLAYTKKSLFEFHPVMWFLRTSRGKNKLISTIKHSLRYRKLFLPTGYGCLMILTSVPVYLVFIKWKNKPKPFQKLMGKSKKTKNK